MTASTSTTDLIAYLSDRFATTRVTEQDVTVALFDLANEYLYSYTGDFAFMLDMHKRVVGYNQQMSAKQAAAVINCAINDYRYALRQQGKQPVQVAVATPVTTTQVVADGRYTIVGSQGGHRTLKVETVEDGQPRQWLSYLCGADNDGDYKSVGFITGNCVELFRKYQGQYADILAAARFLVRNVDKLDEYGRQYALRSGRCYLCNRTLTTPESVARGLGPICAEK